MYKANTKSNKHRKSLVIIAAALLACIIVVGTFFIFNANEKSGGDSTNELESSKAKIDYAPATEEENAGTDDRKTQPSTNPNVVSSPQASSANFDVTITRVTNSAGSKIVTVGTLVTGTRVGTCTVTFTKAGSNPVEATNEITVQDNNYACPNFQIPYESFPSSGQWSAKVSVSVDGTTTKSNTWPETTEVKL